MIYYRQISSGIILLAIFFLLAGCASTSTTKTSRRTDTSAQQAQKAPEKKQYPAISQPSLQPTWSAAGTPVSSTSIKNQTTANQEISIKQADIMFVEQRLLAYEKKFQQWLEVHDGTEDGDSSVLDGLRKDADCEQQFERILTGYGLLLERLQQSDSVPLSKFDTVDSTYMQQLDIEFLESRCSQRAKTDSMLEADFLFEMEEGVSFEQAENMVVSHVEKGQYQEAINAYMDLSLKFPGRQPDMATDLHYGLALQHTGQAEAAARHLQKMLPYASQTVGLSSLQRQIADLTLAAGDPAAAISSYEKLILVLDSYGVEKKWAEEQLAFLKSTDPESEELNAYMKLLREFMTNDYKIHGAGLNEQLYTFALDYAGTPIADSALRLKAFSESQLTIWFGKQLDKVDRLVAEKKFDAAMETLNQLSTYYLPVELQAVLQRTSSEVALAEMRETADQQRLQEMALVEQWNAAVNLLDAQHYDTAIIAFQALLESEYGDKAQAKIIEAANLAAGRMRKDAAGLFIKAGKTADIERKKELLLASHQLLQEILAKYPQTDLLAKVNQNLAVLEEQIKKIDPALLEEPPESDASGEMIQGQMSEKLF
jgi:tetratricopeptide (TPR) repeat protein